MHTCKGQSVIMQPIVYEHDPLLISLSRPIHITSPRLDVMRCYLPPKVPGYKQRHLIISVLGAVILLHIDTTLPSFLF